MSEDRSDPVALVKSAGRYWLIILLVTVFAALAYSAVADFARHARESNDLDRARIEEASQAESKNQIMEGQKTAPPQPIAADVNERVNDSEFPSPMIGGLLALLFIGLMTAVCVTVIASLAAGQNSLVSLIAWILGRDRPADKKSKE